MNLSGARLGQARVWGSAGEPLVASRPITDLGSCRIYLPELPLLGGFHLSLCPQIRVMCGRCAEPQEGGWSHGVRRPKGLCAHLSLDENELGQGELHLKIKFKKLFLSSNITRVTFAHGKNT